MRRRFSGIHFHPIAKSAMLNKANIVGSNGNVGRDAGLPGGKTADKVVVTDA